MHINRIHACRVGLSTLKHSLKNRVIVPVQVQCLPLHCLDTLYHWRRWWARHSRFCPNYIQCEIETLFTERDRIFSLIDRDLCSMTWLWQCWALSGLVIIAPSFWRQTTPRTAKKMESTNFLFVWWNIESRTQRDSFIIVMIMWLSLLDNFIFISTKRKREGLTWELHFTQTRQTPQTHWKLDFEHE